MEVRITGASDDLIEIDGDISEEWNWYSSDAQDSRLIAVSDGTLLRVRYDEDGIWRFMPIVKGTAFAEHIVGDVEADTFDVIVLRGEVHWLVLGTDRAVTKQQ